MITIIAAAAENNALGKNNDLVWHLPDDFKRFKELTSGHYIIMEGKHLKVSQNLFLIVYTLLSHDNKITTPKVYSG